MRKPMKLPGGSLQNHPRVVFSVAVATDREFWRGRSTPSRRRGRPPRAASREDKMPHGLLSPRPHFSLSLSLCVARKP